MDVEKNKASVRRVFEEGFGLGRLEVVDECVSADAVDRHDFTEDEPSLRAHLKRVIAMIRAGIPDLRAHVEGIVGEGDLVAARVVMTGTHTGAPLFGIPAAGRAVRIEQFHFVQCDREGQGVRHWANVAIEETVRQLAGQPAVPIAG